MTKEELEKRCNELFFQVNEKTERIADLEKENAELKEKLKEELKTIADKDLSFVARFDALEKENAELKLKLEALEGQTPWKDIKDKSELIKENAKLKDGIALKDEEVGCIETDFNTFKSKAKEIIKTLLRLWNDVMTEETVKALIVEAEQFLKENE